MSDIRDTISNVAKSVTKTSGDLLKTTKLNMSLSSEESKLKALYMEIGKKVHEIYQYGGSLGIYFDEKYQEILAAEKNISEMKEQIGLIKGVRTCAKCGKNIAKESDFCPKCGTGVDSAVAATIPVAPQPTEIAPTQPVPSEWVNSQPTPPPEPPPMPTKTCRVCNAVNDVSTKFCLSCGRIVD